MTAYPRFFLSRLVCVAVIVCASAAGEARGDSPSAGQPRVEPPYFESDDPIPRDGYRISYITFDEFGQFIERSSFVDTYKILNEVRKAGTGRVLVITFMHGWRHNAEPEDTNVCCFKKLIAELTAQLRGSVGWGDKDLVLGVYLGWPAKKKLLGTELLTFWDRKDAADEVSRGHVIKVLSTLDVFQNHFRDRMTMLTIGHSFGARILFDAIDNVLVARVMAKLSPVGPGLGDKVTGADPDASGLLSRAAGTPFPGELPTVQGLVRGFGDLVVLVNPAFEASRYHVLSDLQSTGQRFQDDQRPLMLIASATNDSATSTMYPLARKREVDRSDAVSDRQFREITETIGNYEPYRTHSLGWCPSLPEPDSTPARECGCDDVPLGIRPGADLTSGAASSDESCHGPLELVESLGGAVSDHGANNPFIVASVPPEVINGHNGIFTVPFVHFIVAYLEALRALPPP